MLFLKRRVVLSLILFIVILSLSGFSIFHNRQLQYMGEMAEEYFHLGVNLHYLGKFTLDTKTPFIFRPPGYPFFIASVLKIWGGMPDINQTFKSKEELDQKKQDAYTAIYLAQCVLLGLSTVILFLWISNHLRLHNAFILALLFGCNPYMLILTGLLHYDLIHIFF